MTTIRGKPLGIGLKVKSMNHNQFWQKATDIHDIYHGKYRRAVLTDEELRETVMDFLVDMDALAGEWCSTQGGNSKEPSEK